MPPRGMPRRKLRTRCMAHFGAARVERWRQHPLRPGDGTLLGQCFSCDGATETLLSPARANSQSKTEKGSGFGGKGTIEFRAPLGRVRACLGALHVDLPQVWTRSVAVPGNPGVELIPSGSEALIGTPVDGPGDHARRQHAGAYAPG